MRNALQALGIAITIALVLSCAATLQMVGVNPVTLLRGGTGTNRGFTAESIRKILLVAQAAIFSILLTGAAAFTMSLRRAAATDFGFNTESVYATHIPFDADEPDMVKRQLNEEAVARIAALPEIEGVTQAYMDPGTNNTFQELKIPGVAEAPSSAFFDVATPDYLKTFGVPLRKGRWIAAGDNASSEPVIVVNEAFANTVWPRSDAIGHCIAVGKGAQPCRTIIGVIGNMFVTGRVDDPPTPIYYIPVAQASAYPQIARIFFRPHGSGAAASAAVRRTLQTLRPDMRAVTVHQVSRNFQWMVAPLKLSASAFAAFGILAALIGGIGLHSMATFAVAQQRRAAAIRIAIGGRPAVVARPILTQSIAVVACGLVIGFVLLIPLSGVLQPMLYHTQLLDPLAIGSVTLLGLGVGLIAAVAPARVVQKSDVMSVLRDE
jgi:putative ABC transport system permease protein